MGRDKGWEGRRGREGGGVRGGREKEGGVGWSPPCEILNTPLNRIILILN